MENHILENARSLRKNMTRQERHLWYDFLRHYPIKIYKQKIIDQYIVDFYCSRAKLVIELDGAQHCEVAAKQYDETRTRWLEQYHITVIRISNLDIDRNFTGVCEYIDQMIKERMTSYD